MKNFKTIMGMFVLFAFLFTSCSKEESTTIKDSEKATLSFGAIVNDLVNNNKNSNKDHLSDFPECSDAQPAYVMIALSQDGNDVVGSMEAPFRVDLVSGQVFTEEVPQLELTPGEYSLDHFMVYDAAGNVIWIAPTGGAMAEYSLDHFMVYDAAGNVIWIAPTGGAMAEYVDNPLPMDINLGAGVKKYVDVSVLCFDNRDVNEYGYLFFEIDKNEAIEFCIFGNFCDETGRHYTAEYSVDVWSYSDGTRGDQIYNDLMNSVEEDANGDLASAPLCIALPDTEGMDEYYFEITLMDGEGYNATERIIRAGVLTDEEVRIFFDGEDNIDYYHFRTGCDNDDNVPVFQDPEEDATFYKAIITELNDSNAKGLAYLKLEDNRLYTTVLASGTEANMLHPQHIHGFADDRNSVCPPASAAGDDGLISLEEGAPFYGPVLLSLVQEDGNFPTANSWGVYTYSKSFMLGEGETISEEDINPLENRVIVLHGMTVDGSYVATLPIACGQIQVIEPFTF